MLRATSLKRDDEGGAVAITTAILLVALIMMAAVVVDLGLLRVDHRDNQMVADMAVTSGGLALGDGLDRVAACEQAWAYLVSNLDGVTSAPEPSPGCATAFAGPCDVAAPDELTGSLLGGSVHVRIRMPVLDSDPPMQNARQTVIPEDGQPCERISVEITQERETILAAVGGFEDGSSLSTAVAMRTYDGTESEYATLIVLEQNDCNSLTATGGGGIVVQNLYDGTGALEAEGLIQLDSDGSAVPSGNCSGASQVVVTPGTAGGSVICSGVEGSPATVFANDDCGSTLDDTLRVVGPDNVTRARFTSGGAQDHQLESDPVLVGSRLTRKLADFEFNCLSGGYPTDATAPQYPGAYLKEAVPACDSGRGPHIDQLVAATMGVGPPAGFTVFADCANTGTVTIQYVYVDCETMPLATFQSDIMVLRGGNLNQHGLDVGNGESLSVEPFPGGAGSAILAVRDGNLTLVNGGAISLTDTMLYLHSGDLRINGGAVTWLAPDEVGYDEITGAPTQCQQLVAANGAPHPSCFQNLSLWSNEYANHTFAGSGAANVRGVFFTPNASFELSGSGGAGAALALENAQFLTRKLVVSGGNGVVMLPNPDIFLESPRYGVGLIR
jgi:hypothetical protein